MITQELILRTAVEKGLSYKEIMIKHSIKSKGTVSYVITKSLTSKGVL